jgi:hypothetical protein
VWAETDEGHEYWADVVEHLLNKASNRTSDGKPYVEPEPPIPEGYRKANADDWRRKDVKFWSVNDLQWNDRPAQESKFDAPIHGTRYIVPIDPPLTDEDACVWPRLLVMVRDESDRDWRGPFEYVCKEDCNSEHPYVVRGQEGRHAWKQARRATPEEIEAANDRS